MKRRIWKPIGRGRLESNYIARQRAPETEKTVSDA
jgi:hypothetical protein